jgi:hypothetical protein
VSTLRCSLTKRGAPASWGRRSASSRAVRALSFPQSFDLDSDSLNSVLDTRESLLEPILLVLAGDKSVLLGPGQPSVQSHITSRG